MSHDARLPERRAWRTAAIYRCCLRFGKDASWALRKIREICPDGSRDHLVENWFIDMDRLRDLREYRARIHDPMVIRLAA